MKTGLKVFSILMIIGGAFLTILGFFASIITLIGGSLAVASGEGKGALLIVAGFIILAGGILELIAGIKGVKASKNSAIAPSCFTLGIIIIAINIASNIFSLANGGELDILNILSGLAVPVGYTVLAKLVSNEANNEIQQ